MSLYKGRRAVLQHLTVYGYIREEYEDIPDDLKDMCYKFYLKVFDEWSIDKCSKGLDIDNQTGIIEAKYKKMTGWKSAFGTIIVKKGDVETWKIKPLFKSSEEKLGKIGLIIGIIEHSKASNIMRCAFCAKYKKAGIGYYGKRTNRIYDGLNGTGTIECDISYWYYPDIITLTLDLTQRGDGNEMFGQLLLQKGSEKEKVIYDKIDLEKEYCFAVSLRLSKIDKYYKFQLLQ